MNLFTSLVDFVARIGARLGDDQGDEYPPDDPFTTTRSPRTRGRNRASSNSPWRG